MLHAEAIRQMDQLRNELVQVDWGILACPLCVGMHDYTVVGMYQGRCHHGTIGLYDRAAQQSCIERQGSGCRTCSRFKHGRGWCCMAQQFPIKLQEAGSQRQLEACCRTELSFSIGVEEGMCMGPG